MPTGTVSNWNFPRPGRRNSEGFGFVKVDGDSGGSGDLFLYADSIKDPKLRSAAKLFGLKNQQRIKFDIEEPLSQRKSRLAINVMPLKDEDDRDRPRSRSRGRRSPSRSPPKRRAMRMVLMESVIPIAPLSGLLVKSVTPTRTQWLLAPKRSAPSPQTQNSWEAVSSD
ncbi:unnamed protein product [Durusdinium trenchii]|uniref:CSD domain-containing protein n=1 Tax=Durusdinium trenchii TaxID=1381693 RepID=A0ABP0IV76_9DINO